MAEKRFEEDELRARLSPEQYRVTQEGGTEPAFSGCYLGEKRAGIFQCVVCETPLFESGTKFESGSGWPSFWQPIDQSRIDEVDDSTHGMRRIEARCHDCGAHLGHVFPDGPPPTGLRYCVNAASLSFAPSED